MVAEGKGRADRWGQAVSGATRARRREPLTRGTELSGRGGARKQAGVNGDARAAVALGPSAQAGLAGLLRWEERAVCWAGRAGKELGRPGRGRRGSRVGPRELGWAWFWFSGFRFSILPFLFAKSLQFKPNKLIEFKLEFEFNPNTQTNKIMLQHECINKVKPKKKKFKY